MDSVVAEADDYDERLLWRIGAKNRREFLLLVADGYSVKRAAEATHRHRDAFAKLLETDPDFYAEFVRARESAADVLEDEAFRRSQERGRHRLGSDRLLEMELKARRPWRYGTKVEVGGPNGGPIKAAVVHVNHAEVFEVLQQAGLLQPGPTIAADAEAPA